MKKLIAILTIAIVLVGAVFAVDPVNTDSEGTSVIDIKTTIGEQFPEYQLKAVSITANTGALTTPIAVKEGAHGLVTIDTNDLLSADVEVGFGIYQIANSRTSVGYDISIKATDLVILVGTTTGEGENAVTTYAVKANPDDDERFAHSLSTTFATTGSVTNVVTITPVTTTSGNFAGYEGGFTVQYLNGKFVNVETATEGTPKEIGTFTYKWGKNKTAKVGNYTATVTMEVTAK